MPDDQESGINSQCEREGFERREIDAADFSVLDPIYRCSSDMSPLCKLRLRQALGLAQLTNSQSNRSHVGVYAKARSFATMAKQSYNR